MGEPLERKIYAGVEAGGTKFVCVIGSDPNNIFEEVNFPTTEPIETISKAVGFIRKNMAEYKLAGLGIASFGPLDLDLNSDTYGYITSTPKAGWSNTNLLGELRDNLGLDSYIDTDVNCASLGEQVWGAAKGMDTFIYITVGTGIGGGGIVNNEMIHGAGHPEMGHIRIPHDLKRDPFEGICLFHGDGLEGLASGPAVEKRWGKRGEELGADHPAWDLEAHYLGMAMANFILTLSPQMIIMGGGIMNTSELIEKVRIETLKNLGGYLQNPELSGSLDNFIVRPKLGDRAGSLGAIALARSQN